MDRVALERGTYPDAVRVDNRPECISVEFKGWAEQHQVLVHYIQPGRPSQNALIARFNRMYREDVLDMNLFFSLCEVQEITHEWLKSYNADRPHESLGGLSPERFARQRAQLLENNENICK